MVDEKRNIVKGWCGRYLSC